MEETTKQKYDRLYGNVHNPLQKLRDFSPDGQPRGREYFLEHVKQVRVALNRLEEFINRHSS